MNSKIQAKEHYLKKLGEKVEADIKLSGANLKLVENKIKKLQDQINDLQDDKAEWERLRREAEELLKNPDPTIKRWLEADFRKEVSLRKRGGDPEMVQRLGRPVYGLQYKNKNRRTVSIPKLRRDGGREFYQSEDVDIVDRISNESAYREWEIYMEKGMDINPGWTFEELFSEIEKFFQNAPDLERYGEKYTVYEGSGAPYYPAAVEM